MGYNEITVSYKINNQTHGDTSKSNSVLKGTVVATMVSNTPTAGNHTSF